MCILVSTSRTEKQLKVPEDTVTDLLMIIHTLARTLRDIRKQCESCYNESDTTLEDKADKESILEEFDEYIRMAEIYSQLATVLNTRAKSNTQLVE